MKIEVRRGDITKIEIDAIVNAANTSLLGGGGVDGAIHKAGGSKILEECIAIRDRQGGCAVGEVVYTSGGNLKVKYVIHTVGPVWNGDNPEKSALLRNCYYHALRLAEELYVTSIAFPNISTGIYHFPKNKAAKIAIDTVKNFPAQSIETLVFVCFDEENYQLYQNLLQ